MLFLLGSRSRKINICTTLTYSLIIIRRVRRDHASTRHRRLWRNTQAFIRMILSCRPLVWYFKYHWMLSSTSKLLLDCSDFHISVLCCGGDLTDFVSLSLAMICSRTWDSEFQRYYHLDEESSAWVVSISWVKTKNCLNSSSCRTQRYHSGSCKMTIRTTGATIVGRQASRKEKYFKNIRSVNIYHEKFIS